MKKLRIIIHIATVLLIIIALVGIVIQITSPKPAPDTAFDLITLSISVASIALVITTQMTSYQDRQRFMRMVQELGKLDAEMDSELKAEKDIDRTIHKELAAEQDIDKTLHKKLDAITAKLDALDRTITTKKGKK